eukprot:3530426-Amphidinium_carterae.1
MPLKVLGLDESLRGPTETTPHSNRFAKLAVVRFHTSAVMLQYWRSGYLLQTQDCKGTSS